MISHEPPISLAHYPTMLNEQDWLHLYGELNSVVAWRALDIKAFYVFGVIHNYCESVEWLLKFPDPGTPNPWPVTYLPAFSLCASGIELLGRCLRGDDRHSGTSGANLREGFGWLAQSRPNNASRPGVVAVTNYAEYEVNALVHLRHFTAHGQALTARSRSDSSRYVFQSIDIELLDSFPQLIGNAMERYWTSLREDREACENLASAGVIPLRSEPILEILRLFDSGMSAGELFYKFDWQVYK